MLDAMQAWGAPQDEIDQVRAQLDQAVHVAEEQPFAVYADNWTTVMAWTALAPRWQYVAMPSQGPGFGTVVLRTGLDWAGVEAWIDRHVRRRQRKALSTNLQIMERAALHADRELREKEE